MESLVKKKLSQLKGKVTVLLGGQKVIPIKRTKRGRPRKPIVAPDKETVKRKMTLAKTIKEVMKEANRPMRVKEVTQAVFDRGYQTKIKNFQYFSSSVSKILREGEDYKKVQHGVYQYS